MSRIIRLLVERSMPVEYLESTLPIDYGKAVLRRQARADDRVNSQLQISCGAIHHPKLSHQARADHWHNKSSNGFKISCSGIVSTRRSSRSGCVRPATRRKPV
jgi:hypothetical protein